VTFPHDARLYLVAGAELRAGKLADLAGDLASAGVDLIQLREKEMEAGELLEIGGPVAAACRAAGIPFIVNDRPDVARALQADGVHLGTRDLPTRVAREILPGPIVGRSTHTPADITEAIANQDPDYIAVGPVYETPTKPGRPAAGLELIEHAAAAGIPVPWFAIGGIDLATLDTVLDAGARRVVVVRAITEAEDPGAVTEQLKQRLLDAPL
jgi:thiamine-phosphate pyrophosphorylase